MKATAGSGTVEGAGRRTKASLAAWALALVSFAMLAIAAVYGVRTGTFEWAVVWLVIYPLLGLVIALRRPRNPLGWIWLAGALCFGFAVFAPAYAAYSLAHGLELPGARFLGAVNSYFGNLGYGMILPYTCLLFPNGRLPSPRWRPLLWLVIANNILGFIGLLQFAPAFAESTPVVVATAIYPNLVLLLFFGTPLAAIIRYRGGDRQERQQIKWFAYAVAVGVCLAFIMQFGSSLVDTSPAAWQLAGNLLWLGINVLVLGSIAVAMLAYKLYDIDVLIRKTLIYGAVTAVLTFVFAGVVLLGQRVFTALSGQQSPVAVVVSTLAIAALFSPLRRRVQDFVDRRFYRRKYDAARVLADFGRIARSETDLVALTAALDAAVTDAMQPTRAGVWIAPAGDNRGTTP